MHSPFLLNPVSQSTFSNLGIKIICIIYIIVERDLPIPVVLLVIPFPCMIRILFILFFSASIKPVLYWFRLFLLCHTFKKLFILKDIYFYLTHIRVLSAYMYVYCMHTWYLYRPEKGIGSSACAGTGKHTCAFPYPTHIALFCPYLLTLSWTLLG